MFGELDLIVGVDKEVIDKKITNLSEFMWNKGLIRFMNVAEAFVHLLGNAITEKCSQGLHEFPQRKQQAQGD